MSNQEIFKSALNKVRKTIRTTGFLDYKNYLEKLYRALKAEIEKYTYIQFAEDLGFSKTNVIHRIIKGKRPLTLKAAERISDALDLPPVEREYFLSLTNYHYARETVERTDSLKRMLDLKTRMVHSELAKSQLEYFSEWFHPVIRELIALPDFKSDPEWIAQKLRPHIRREQVENSLELLKSLNLIQVSKGGKISLSDENVTTGDEVKGIALVKYHQTMISMGIDALASVEAKNRDISSITVSISEETIAELKSEIQMFRKKLMAIADKAENKKLVYQVNFQLFPLTHKSERES